MSILPCGLIERGRMCQNTFRWPDLLKNLLQFFIAHKGIG